MSCLGASAAPAAAERNHQRIRLRHVTDGDVFVDELGDKATLVVRSQAEDEEAAERLQRELRLRAQEALRAEGVF